MHLRILLPTLLPALALTMGVAAPSLASAECSDSSGLCVDSGEAEWEADGTVSDKQKRKERKLRNKESVSLSVSIDGDGRGTVFLDGRYAGVAPLNSFSLPPGSHEIQVRDGSRVLAEGSLKFPAGETVQLSISY